MQPQIPTYTMHLPANRRHARKYVGMAEREKLDMFIYFLTPTFRKGYEPAEVQYLFDGVQELNFPVG